MLVCLCTHECMCTYLYLTDTEKSGFFYYVFSVYLRMSVSGYEHVNTGAFKSQLLGCRLEHGRLKSILSSQQESWYARLITEPFLHPQD